MNNPIFNRRHIIEYFVYGLLASVLFIIPVLIFLNRAQYAHLYYICGGTALFMFTIFFYALQLVNRPYDSKRAVSMLIAGNLATLAGVMFSAFFVLISFLIKYPGLFSSIPTENVLRNAPASLQSNNPSDLLFM